MKLLLVFVRRYPGQSVFLVAALLLAGVAEGVGLSALLPLLQLAFDGATSADDNPFARYVNEAFATLHMTPSIGLLLLIVVVVVLLKNVLIFLSEQRIGYIAADVATELRMTLLRRLIGARWEYFVTQSAGRLANSMSTESWRAANAYVFAVRVLVALVQATVYTLVAVLVSWQAALFCFTLGLVIVGVSQAFVRMSQRAGNRQTEQYRSLLGTLTDVVQSVKPFKAMGRTHIAEELVSRETHKLRRALKREVLGTAGLESAQEPMFAAFAAGGVYVALIVFEAKLATVVFMVAVLANVLKQISRVQKQYQRLVTCESAYYAIEETIARAAAAAEHASGTAAPRFERAVELDHVTFGYGDQTLLVDTTLAVPAGEITCLTGDSGTGKTTVADLFVGLVQPSSGRVLIDGVPLEEIDLDAWRACIGYVPQENLLLHDTILRNVTLGDTALDRSDAEAALEAAGADFVAELPQGIDTVVGERGTRFSGGQRQRIMIARALVHHPRLLILDEATSALDPASERAICDTLERLRGKLTILAITHREPLAEIADAVYQLRDGRPHVSKKVAFARGAVSLSPR